MHSHVGGHEKDRTTRRRLAKSNACPRNPVAASQHRVVPGYLAVDLRKNPLPLTHALCTCTLIDSTTVIVHLAVLITPQVSCRTLPLASSWPGLLAALELREKVRDGLGLQAHTVRLSAVHGMHKNGIGALSRLMLNTTTEGRKNTSPHCEGAASAKGSCTAHAESSRTSRNIKQECTWKCRIEQNEAESCFACRIDQTWC